MAKKDFEGDLERVACAGEADMLGNEKIKIQNEHKIIKKYEKK